MTRKRWFRLSTSLPALLLALSCASLSDRPSGPQGRTDAEPEAMGQAAPSGTFVWISDPHFTPFYPYSCWTKQGGKPITAMLEQLVDRGTPASPRWKEHTEWGAVFSQFGPQSDAYSERGSDTNDKLLQEVLSKAGETVPNPDFVLLTGDMLGHGFGCDYADLAPAGMNTPAAYASFVAQTIKYLGLSLRSRFDTAPRPPVFATLGNNDANCGDYDLHLDHPGSTFLADTAETFLDYFMPGMSAAERQAFHATFDRGGYYTAAVPNAGGNRLIVLNSVPFMCTYPYKDEASFPPTRQSCAASPIVDAAAQLRWLASEGGQPGRAWIAAHVPPGNGCYGSAPNWTSADLDTFSKLHVQAGTGSRFAGTLAAHSHMASFKLLRDASGNAASFVLQAPSISPNHKNNSTFSRVDYDPGSLEITSLEVHYLDLDQASATWGSFPFAGLQGSVTAATLDALYGRLGTDAASWATFVADYGSHAGSVVSLGDLTQTNLGCLGSLD